MLRLLVLLLLLANGAYFAWSQGHLLPWGMGPAQQAEPQRAQQQIRPEAIRLLRPDELARSDTAAPVGVVCLQAGLLDDGQAGAARALLEPWPSGSWKLEPVVEPGRWIVYMGKYLTPELVDRKKAELRQLGIVFEPLSNAALEPGLSLGGYGSEAEAQRRLDTLVDRGVRTARLMQERPEARGLKLVLPAVDEALRPRVDELRAALALNGKSLRPCR
jgi:hypothetical protein